MQTLREAGTVSGDERQWKENLLGRGKQHKRNSVGAREQRTSVESRGAEELLVCIFIWTYSWTFCYPRRGLNLRNYLARRLDRGRLGERLAIASPREWSEGVQEVKSPATLCPDASGALNVSVHRNSVYVAQAVI